MDSRTRGPDSARREGHGQGLNPAELKIDLLCRGIKIDPSCDIDADGCSLVRTRAGLGSGLELLLPGSPRALCANAPVVESFVQATPYALSRTRDGYSLTDNRQGRLYPVRLNPRPSWYDRPTSRGVPMARVGTMQGTCLSIYLGDRCQFWSDSHPMNCKFCTSGLNVGVDEEMEKSVDDVAETALAARKESGVTFVHLNSGYQGIGGLRKVAPYLEALKRRTGLLTGVQFTPERDLSIYDEIIKLGVDHLSFCFEFFNPEYFERYLPGKTAVFGRETFFRALEYTSRKLGRGRVSGEIIAGVEPLRDTLRAIEYIVMVGAFPLVCIFRPLKGAEMETHAAPEYTEMLTVFRHVYETCRRHRLPVGIAPNINVSLSLPPEDTFYLAEGTAGDRLYQGWMRMLKRVMRPYFLRRIYSTPS